MPQLWLVALVLALARGAQESAVLPRDVAPVAEEHAEAARRAEALLAQAREALHAPGITAAVALDGELVWSAALGFADLAAQRPMTRDTAMRIGSVSKALTGIALARMLERGEIELDAAVTRYLPQYPAHEPPITVRQLACHQSGIRHYQGLEFMSRAHCERIEEAFAVFAADELVAPPGSAYHYSTYGYTVLSAAMEAAAEVEFLALVRREVFEPIGLRHTGPELEGHAPEPRATPYVNLADSPPAPANPADLSCKWAGGGFLSTSVELVRVGGAMLDGTLLSPDAFELVATPQPLEDGSPSGAPYGLGWRSETMHLPSGRAVFAVHHSGVALGGTAFLLLMPDEGLVIAANHNLYQSQRFGDFNRTVTELAETFLASHER